MSGPLHGRTVSFKLVLLGDAAVGKSSSVDRFVRNEFSDFQQPTIGAAFLTQIVNLEDRIVKFEIWDTAGQERYRSLAPMYYRGAGAALVVYDITDPDSFHGAKTWIEELHRQGNPEIIIALAGNKCDLEEKRKVSTLEARSYADEQGCLFFETSAKTGQNIHEVFRAIAERLPREIVPLGGDNDDNVEILADSQSRGCC